MPSSAYALYDSFDWRLYRRGYSLYRQGDRLVLSSLSDGIELSSAPAFDEPGFAWDLPHGGLHDELGPILEMRKLIELASGGKPFYHPSYSEPRSKNCGAFVL